MDIGLTIPFAQTSSSVGFLASTSTDLDATLANLKSLVLTNWGERPNHYHLGCNLSEFLFQQITPELKDAVIERIETQVTKWIPYILLKSVNVEFTDDSHYIRVIIDFQLKSGQKPKSLFVQDFPAGA